MRLIEDLLDYLGETGLWPIVIGLLSLALGTAALLREGNVFLGVVGSFLATSGVQILLWKLGFRSELLGNAFDDTASKYARRIDAEQEDLERDIEKLELKLKLIELEQRRNELVDKLKKRHIGPFD